MAPIEFVRGNTNRFIRVVFSDADGHQVSSTLTLTMTCNGLPACNSQCGNVRCAANNNQCASTEGTPISDSQLCSFCNANCPTCTTGCACFDDSPNCQGGSDCLVAVNNEGQGTGFQCRANGDPTLRPDGFVTWSVDGRQVPVSIEVAFSTPVTRNDLGQVLCADFGGLNFATSAALPSAIPSGEAVVSFEDSCQATSLTTLRNCEPVMGSAPLVDRQGLPRTWTDPLDGTPIGG